MNADDKLNSFWINTIDSAIRSYRFHNESETPQRIITSPGILKALVESGFHGRWPDVGIVSSEDLDVPFELVARTVADSKVDEAIELILDNAKERILRLVRVAE